MFGNEEGYRREGGYRGGLKLGGIAVVLAFAFMLARPWLNQIGWLGSVSTEKGADAMLLDDPRIGATMRTIERLFPKDYAIIREGVRAQAAKGDIAQVRTAFSQQMAEFYRRHAADFAQAPDADLRQLIEVHLKLADQLHMQTNACARFFVGTLSSDESLMPPADTLLEEFTQLRLTAMAHGRDTPAGRKIGPVDAKTGAMLGDALRGSGAPLTTMEFYGGQRKLDGMTVGMRCEAGWHLIRAIRGMPIEEGYPLYVTAFGIG